MCFLGGGELGWFCLFVWEEIEDERKSGLQMDYFLLFSF